MRAHPTALPQPSDAVSRTRGQWSSLLALVPSSIQLLSTGSVARQGIELLSNALSSRRFASVLKSAQGHLRDASLPILIREGDPPGSDYIESLSRSQRRWLGQLALELYFMQIFRGEVAIVDLWPSRFGVDDAGDALWSPRPFYLRWDPRFREALQDVYAGFFLEDHARFELGVFELELGQSSDVLVQHFGEGNQRSVRFGAAALQQTLSTMSTQRGPGDRPLHPNFIGFGLYLTALHELLERLDMKFDVRAAFMRSYPARSQR